MTLNSIDEHVNSNGVVVYRAGKDQGEGAAEAAIAPGSMLKKGTALGEVDLAGVGDDVIGYAPDNVTNASESLLADYAIADTVQFYRSAGDKFMGLVTDAGTIAKGAALEAAASGELRLFIAGPQVATYIGDADVVAPSSSRLLVKYGSA